MLSDVEMSFIILRVTLRLIAMHKIEIFCIFYYVFYQLISTNIEFLCINFRCREKPQNDNSLCPKKLTYLFYIIFFYAYLHCE